VDCDRVREIQSAALDGEAGMAEAAHASAHTERCLACRRWATAARRLERSLQGMATAVDASARLSSSIGPVDTTAAILARLDGPAPARRGPGRARALRIGLVVMGGLNLAVAACLAFGVHVGVLEPVAEHAGRELAAFQSTLGAAFLLAAWDGRARGRVGIAATGVVLLVLTALADLAEGETQVAYELTHLPEIVGLGLLLLLRSSEAPAPGLRPGRFGRGSGAVARRARGGAQRAA